uniref:Putative ovule protein n=1 Tax=Solanum chacoense TaxID=4108 RepID=A0A0V0GTU9_SOLCH
MPIAHHARRGKSLDLGSGCGINKNVSRKTCFIEKFSTLSSELYWITISAIKAHFIVNKKFTNFNTLVLWHERLGHHRSIMMG